MPLGFSNDVSHFAKRSFVGVRDQNIRRMLNQPLNYADHLFARLAGAKYNFGKALPRRARMIDARVADVFVMKAADAARCFVRLNLTAFVGRQQLFECFQIHVCYCNEIASYAQT